MRLLIIGLALVGCGKVSSKMPDAPAGGSDAPRLDTPVGIDAAKLCDPTGTFDAPTLLTGFSSAAIEASATLSPDELNIYVAVDKGAAAPNWEFVSAQRADRTADFGTQMLMTAVNSTALEDQGSVSADGLVFLFESNRVANEGYHLYVSTRSSTLGTFGTPSLLAGVNSPTTTNNDENPYMTADGSEVWFVSDRSNGIGGRDVYRAPKVGASYANPVLVPELSSASTEYCPVLTADRLTVYFSSNRDGSGQFDIYTAHRANVGDGFPTPTKVSEVNSNVGDYPDWISPDNCRLYFRSDRTGNGDIYVAARHPL